ncbi:hypothetical protein GBA52_000505 [Prunus armeniaca]|nr:hypothetical protein GBA52_000505 [Prunus armeniaca]
MAEIISGLVSPIMLLGEWLWSPVKRGFGYMVHYKRSIQSLNIQIEKLQEIKNGFQDLVDAFQMNGEEVKPEIKKWFEDANKAITDAAQLSGKAEASQNCAREMCPNLGWRYSSGKKVIKQIAAVKKLQKEGKFETISVQVPHPIEIESTMSTGGFQAFGSTRKAMDQVMTALKDDKVTVIGVYGMGGVGKTTMVKQVGAQARKDGLFDHVIMAVFSQNPDLMKIQGQLSDMLGLKLREETELGRAGRLKERILRGNKTLIILDDIWNASQNLTSVGIPSPIELQGCNSKVLLTTRRLNVCHVMKSHVKVHLDVLSVEDSWNLFTKEAGRSFDSRTSYDVARKVAGECAGLPIALIAVARALGDKDLEEWKEATRRLERSQPATLEDEGEVFKCIKLSFDYLKGEDAKSCFLLCSLFPEDSHIAIQDLFSYGFGYGLFRDGMTLEEARARAHSVIKYLKASSLLLDGETEQYVRMHDVIRDMAISIGLSELGHGFLVKAGWDLKLWPNDADEGCSTISLKYNCISKLPEDLVCPKLQILLLDNNGTLHEIPETYFQGMNALRILDLSKTSISFLPLLVLDTSINTLPSWFNSVVTETAKKIIYTKCRGLNNFLAEYATERLHGLISLRVQYCNGMLSLMNTTTTVVPNRPVFENLEELYVTEMEDLKELCVGVLPHGSLGNLKLLEVSACKVLSTFLQPNLWQKLQNLEVVIIERMPRLEYVFQSEGVKEEQTVFRKWREMKLSFLPELKCIWKGPAQYAIFHNLKFLSASLCTKLKSIFTTDVSQCLLQLEELQIKYCSSLETVIGPSAGTLEKKIIFPQLRNLTLQWLPELKSFYSGGSGGVECPSLELLNVYKCPQFLISTSVFHSQKQVQVTGEFHFPYFSSKRGFCGNL